MKTIYLILAICFVSVFAENEQSVYKIPSIQDAFDKVLNNIGDIISHLDNATNGKLKEIFEQLKSVLPKIAGKIHDKIKVLMGKISKFTGKSVRAEDPRILDKLTELSTNVQNLIASIVTNLVASIGKRETIEQKWAENAKIPLEIVIKLKDLFQKLKAKIQKEKQTKEQTEEVVTRGVLDFLKNTLGLQSVWDEIKNLGNSVLGELMAVGAKLLFAGSQKLAEAQQIFGKLVSDLTNHAGDAGSLVAASIAALKGILGNKREVDEIVTRGVLDFLKNTLGLQSVWDEIKNLGNSVLGELMAVGAKLLFAGSQKLAEAQQIFGKLVSDLTNHAGDAGSLVAASIAALKGILGNKREVDEIVTRGVLDFLKNTLGLQSVWDEIKNLGNSVLGELMAVGAKLLFAGSQKLAEAQQIFGKLVSDLTNHAGDAGSLVAASIAALKGILGN